MVYPPIPSAPPPPRRPSARRSPRPALIALVAGLVGALLGSAVATVTLQRAFEGDRSAPAPLPAVAPPLPPTTGSDEVDRVARVAEIVLPSVVRVDVDPDAFAGGNGSGVVYRADGHIITNNHVVANAEELSVMLADGTSAAAEVVGTDELHDLAVIKVARNGLAPIRIGASSTLRVGELAVAVGSPFGLEGTVTAGVVSAVDRGVDVVGPSGRPLTLARVIQTDAPINPGNSGGALVDGDARLIGINSAILTSGQPANAGVGFAIPVETVVEVAEQLIGRGYVAHPFLGVQGETVPEGARVAEVQPGTPADEAGLRSGDVIIGVDDHPIASMSDLVTVILIYEVGDRVTVTYIREGQERAVNVTLGERPRE